MVDRIFVHAKGRMAGLTGRPRRILVDALVKRASINDKSFGKSFNGAVDVGLAVAVVDY